MQPESSTPPRPRVLVFLESDIVVRHFIDSGVFAEAIECCDVCFVVPPRIERRFVRTPNAVDYGARHRELAPPRRRLFWWRTLFQVDQVRWRPGADHAALRRMRSYQIASRRVRWMYRVLALPGIFQVFRAWALMRLRVLPFDALDTLIAEEQPDVLLHPTVLDGIYVNEVVEAAARHGIPSVFIMNSWDNPSTKRSVIGQPDRLLVWGSQTREHAVRYMNIDRDRVVSFGAAQFDVYREPPRRTRTELLHEHGIDTAKRVLLYAGASKAVDEYADLCLLDEAIERGDLANTAVLYRPHPWGRGGVGGGRIVDHPWRHVSVENTMLDYLVKVRDGEKDLRAFPDYHNTVDVLQAADALVSPLSTIILEAVMLGKASICYLPQDTPGDTLGNQAGLTHFRELFQAEAIPKVHRREDLVAAAEQALTRAGDADHAALLKSVAAYFISPFDEPYGERLVKFLRMVADDT
ncbi:MAG: hypothetical protein O3B22_08220 [Proteobacteria bacterium]|nr:hypothetical protein [Pseudomonadota bacterium]